MKNKQGKYNMSLNSLNVVPNDPTIMKAKLIVFDFLESGNHQCITQAVAEENISTLIGKRICCKYISKDNNEGIDALGSHEETETTDRCGNEVIYCETDAIGFIDNVYIDDYTDENGNTKKVVYADAILWTDDHYKDIINLLKEWLNNGIKIVMSCEYLYFNFIMKDGIEYIQSPILFTAHTLLNSEDRGEAIEIAPSYECASMLSLNELESYNKAINKLKVNNSKKEETNNMENKFLKALNELSVGDLRSSIMTALGDVMTGNEYENLWISNYGIFPESKYFIYETYEDSKWVNYKVTYSLGENDIIVLDYTNKEKVEGQYTYVSVNELQKSENAVKDLEQANGKIEELNSKIKSLNEKVTEKSKNNKADVEKFTELTETLVALNSKVAKMQPIVDKYNEDNFQKALNEAIKKYKEKFTSVNALDKFEEDEVQNLIKDLVGSDSDVSMKALNSLNNLLVDSISSLQKEDIDDIMSNTTKISINQISKLKDNNDLIANDSDEIYKDKYGINY